MLRAIAARVSALTLSKMYARVPAAMKDPLARAIRRVRLKSAVRLYVPAVILFTALAWLGLAWESHGVLHLWEKVFGPLVIEDRMLMWLFVAITAVVGIGTFFLFRYLVRKELYRDFLYCGCCDAFDFDEVGACPICQEPLTKKESFFFLEFEDEREILQSFGLHECKKAQPAASADGHTDVP